ncbi:hypothetical protein B0T26DRAFT_700617, partial [Lasiosphaeria miniovina]
MHDNFPLSLTVDSSQFGDSSSQKPLLLPCQRVLQGPPSPFPDPSRARSTPGLERRGVPVSYPCYNINGVSVAAYCFAVSRLFQYGRFAANFGPPRRRRPSVYTDNGGLAVGQVLHQRV